MNLHTFPEAPFRLNNWTAHGYQCVLDKTPDRMLDIQARPCRADPTLTLACPCRLLGLFPVLLRLLPTGLAGCADVACVILAGPCVLRAAYVASLGPRSAAAPPPRCTAGHAC